MRGSKGTLRTVTPRSSAARRQGATLAWWSRSVTTTSSPGSQARLSDRAKAKVSVVMFAPKAISRGEPAPRKSAIASRAESTAASASRLVGKDPWTLALWRRSVPATASATARGTWLPPGPSKKASGRPAKRRSKTGKSERTRSANEASCMDQDGDGVQRARGGGLSPLTPRVKSTFLRRTGRGQDTAQNPSSAAPSGLSRSFSKARLRIWRMRSRVTPSSEPISSSVRSSPSSSP